MPDPKRANILLVDDRPEGLKALETVLSDLGENLLRAGSGQEALAMALDREFAVILLDVRMPEMDGFETAKFLRSRAKNRHTPIIFVTGMDESSVNIERGYRVGAVDLLFKPFVPEVLRSKVIFYLDLFRKNEALEEAKRTLELEMQERRRAEEERNRAQSELLQGQKLQATGQLAAGIAHEINNPTAYILSNLGTVREYLREIGEYLRAEEEGAALGSAPSGTATRARKLTRQELEELLEDFESAISDCHAGAQRIQRIIRGLREFVHPDESELRKVDLTVLLESALELCSNELKYEVTLHRNYQAVPPVLCFPGQIEQVFVNILVNAAQAMTGKKGELHLETRPEADGVRVSIRDTGPGVSEEHRARLFLPFFTTKPVGKGTGLGLHVAYKIVRAHGGRIEIAGETGKGAEFIIHLPLQLRPDAT